MDGAVVVESKSKENVAENNEEKDEKRVQSASNTRPPTMRKRSYSFSDGNSILLNSAWNSSNNYFRLHEASCTAPGQEVEDRPGGPRWERAGPGRRGQQ